MSTHRVDVVRIGEIVKHPNADTLGLVQIYGWTCAIRLGDFQPGDLCAYIEPDYVVPSAGPFEFLCKEGKPARIKAKRLRGTWSQGLLVRAPEGAAEGDDVMEHFGIVRYEPQMKGGLSSGGDAEAPCAALAYCPRYDLENWRRYRHLLVEGETVFVSEKLHGANSRFAWREERMWCGSRTQWKRRPDDALPTSDPWWLAHRQHPWIEAWCQMHPEAVLYGEVFGPVQDLKYDAKPGEIFFRAFDALTRDRWQDAQDFFGFGTPGSTLPPGFFEDARVPLLYVGAYSEAKMEELAEGDSALAKHLREGIVIKPAVERHDPQIGRVALKLVSNRYLERS
jgi:RNA ligase (TIGR02306 family)